MLWKHTSEATRNARGFMEQWQENRRKDKNLGGNTTPAVAKISVITDDGLVEW